jgi:putrescine transport system permease protein
MKIKISSLFMIFGFVFLYIPMIVIVFFSFNNSRLLSIWGGFSTRWYTELISDAELWSALLQSLNIAFISASIGVILGMFASLAISRSKFISKKLFIFLSMLPLVMPEIILGVSLLVLFETCSKIIGWPTVMNATTVIIAHSTFCMAYVALIIQVQLAQVDKSIEEAALDLGATPFKRFIMITLPMITPSLLSGWLMSFTLSLDDLILATFTSGPGTTTLPILIYSRIKLGLNPEINVLGTIIIGFVIICSFFSYLIRRRNKFFQKSKI